MKYRIKKNPLGGKTLVRTTFKGVKRVYGDSFKTLDGTEYVTLNTGERFRVTPKPYVGKSGRRQHINERRLAKPADC